MFDAFSLAARRVIFLARYEAGRLKFDSIDAPQILLGFILEDQGLSDRQTRRILRMHDSPDSGPTWSAAPPRTEESFLSGETALTLQSLFSGFGPRPESQPDHGDMPLTKEARVVFKGAQKYAAGGTVTPLHLLWAMLDEKAGPVAAVLRENGLTREQVETEIRKRSQSSLE